MALMETDFITIKEKMNKIDQKLDGLYQNWQAEYKEAMNPEHEYQILKQASQEQTKVPPPNHLLWE